MVFKQLGKIERIRLKLTESETSLDSNVVFTIQQQMLIAN